MKTRFAFSKTFPLENPLKKLARVLDQDIDQEVSETVVVFVHAEASDARARARASAVLRQSLKHVKWLANKRACKNIVLHSFTILAVTPPNLVLLKR